MITIAVPHHETLHIAKPITHGAFILALTSIMACGYLLRLDEFKEGDPPAGGSGSTGGNSSTDSGIGGGGASGTGKSSSSGSGGASGTGGTGAGSSSSGGGSTTGAAGSGTGGTGGVLWSKLAQNDEVVSNTGNFGTDKDAGQGFTLALDSTVTMVSFKGSKGNSSIGTKLRVEIRGTSIDGPVLKDEQFATEMLPLYTETPGWINLPFNSDLILSGSGKQYFVRIYAVNGHLTDELRWSYVEVNTYPEGSKFSGAVEVSGEDRNFIIWGHTP